MTRTQHRPAEVNGVPMRSTLEARWATFFSALSFPWTYEPESFVLADKWRYTPDFHVEHLGYVEVKPTLAHLRESWPRIKRFTQLYPEKVLYLFPGDRVYFRDVIRFQGQSIYRPTIRQMFVTLALIRHANSKVPYGTICDAINVAQQTANSATISHLIPIRAVFAFTDALNDLFP